MNLRPLRFVQTDGKVARNFQKVLGRNELIHQAHGEGLWNLGQ